MRKKAAKKAVVKPKSRRVSSASGGKRKPLNTSTAKDKEKLIRIWNEDLCE